MRDAVLWRKMARIVVLLADALSITPEEALDKFYHSNTYALLVNPETGLYLMSDLYIMDDLLEELTSKDPK